jgi:hypothetical protein
MTRMKKMGKIRRGVNRRKALKDAEREKKGADQDHPERSEAV